MTPGRTPEAAIRAGKRGDPSRGKRLFEAYVLEEWLPHHQLEPGVRSEYARQIRKHLLPCFGPMKMRDIMPEQVRQWVTAMQAQGVRPRTIQYCKVSILNAIFTTALADEVVTIHPSRGVKTPPVPRKPRRIITAAEFDLLYQALPDSDTRLLVETDIESGLRWGELTELRPRDLDLPTRILTVSRAVVDGSTRRASITAAGSWSRTTRRTRSTGGSSSAPRSPPRSWPTSAPVGSGLTTCCSVTKPQTGPPSTRRLAVVDSAGLTDPDGNGRRYRHGTLTAYNAARCRCEHCRGAYASYRAARRSAGKDSPRARRTRETDGHIPADWFRSQVWYPARDAA